ncbi:hypothetical protein Goarm_022367 [Gossypium armourianum]|uniref:Reverse transcriptase zinc-binding domain-containing protein n=1 Tax=Gossypium armourianum TaxID=34283 RepID=A0A7J9KHF4_9ROSI|nr:hypothetical protein [Gossypium armourianum]
MVRDHNVLIVADLIDNANREWRRDIITDTFSNADAARIFRIPLVKEPHEDVMVWRCEPSGEFFVRSAYKLLRYGIPSPTFNELQATSRGFYRKLWSLNHACISGSVDYKLSSMVRDNNILIVADLIDNANREWRRKIIIDTFFDADAARIFQIPLAKEPHEDVMVWRCELLGEFFIRSAYKLLQSGIPSPTFNELQATSKGFYKKLWSLNLPSKIKITVWRISKNFIPNLSNMYCKRLMVNTMCPKCGGGAETTDHVFRSCHTSKAVWELVGYLWILSNTT